MADINVERKGPSIWPWVIGLLVLALLIWAIAEMVDTDEGVDEVATDQVERVEEPPAAVPTPSPTQPGMDAVDIETLTPIESDDIGRQVRLNGEIVGQPTQEGFWVRLETDGTAQQQQDAQQQDGQQRDEVLFIQAPAMTQDGDELTAQDVREGQNVELHGTLERLESEQMQQHLQQSQLEQEEDYQNWTVVSDVMLTSQQTAQQPGQQDQQMQPGQQQPGMQQDTVQGRY